MAFFKKKINKIGAYLSSQGLKKNQIVMLRGKNCIDILLCQLAIISIGSIVLLLNPYLSKFLLDELLVHLNIDFIIDFNLDKSYLFNYSKLEYFNYNKYKIKNNFKLLKYSELLKKPATLILTSGSNGLPKAVVHNIFAHMNSANSVLDVINYEKYDCWLLSLPLFHISGQGIVWRWLLRGGLIAFKEKKLSDSLHGVTHVSLVPTQLFRLFNKDRRILLNLKEILLGGSMIPISLTTKIANLGITCWCSYGMTEMASTVCIKVTNNKNGVGLPLKGKKIRIINNEIQIKSNTKALGYWFDGDIVPLNCINGWFKTNDRGAYINGEYHVFGRLDNLFFSGGEFIQPEYIEKIINSHKNVIQSFIIPIKDKEFGYKPVAVLELREKTSISIIEKWLKDKVAPYQYPIYFCRLLPEFKVCINKISRKYIKKWFLSKNIFK
ncbi:o-succinylbenzoate--CoA ligase [Candidatus Providencia siddallii]|uniref:o-succinylbenzoate--CoA ligase n=1 Tax=Candidatus Providencia siddallii TaxID=1715285 RepID=UPI00312CABB4